MLIIDNILDHNDIFYDTIILPPNLTVKYNEMHFDNDKKMLKLSFYTKLKLAEQLQLTDCTIHYNEFNKPYFKKDNLVINFNLSHHDNTIILYYNDNLMVGIDILNTDKVNISSFYCPYFSKEEQEYCTTKEKFCEIWLLKESYSKMIGNGLTENLKNINLLNYRNNINLNFQFIDINNLKVCLCNKI